MTERKCTEGRGKARKGTERYGAFIEAEIGGVMELLEVKGITKNYKRFALQDISFTLPAGYIMGYVGQNGAGKTTTLHSITHLIKTDGGESWIDGLTFDKDPVEYRNSIGYIGDSSYFPKDLTLRDIRSILASFYPSFDKDKFDAYIERWSLPAKEKVSGFSRGMKVKLMFASVLSRETKLLILDEATNGLDPVVRRDILRILQDYIADGSRSVLFSTHIMEDLEDIADYIFFIDQGRKIFCEAKDDLLEKWLLVRGGREDLTGELEKVLVGIERHAYGFTALFPTEGGVILPAGIAAEKPSIDEIIIHQIEGGSL